MRVVLSLFVSGAVGGASEGKFPHINHSGGNTDK